MREEVILNKKEQKRVRDLSRMVTVLASMVELRGFEPLTF